MKTRLASRNDAKILAKTLRAGLAEQSVELSHGHALDIVARQFGCRDWNHLAALMPETEPDDAPSFHMTAPVLRIFDEAKAREFYLGFLGFRLDWEHRFESDLPLYAQVSRGADERRLVLHLSGHHGDATPGSTVFVAMEGIRAFHRELIEQNNPNMRPGVEELPWGLQMQVTDPFGNRVRFCEQRHS